jgi:hypothetical protein
VQREQQHGSRSVVSSRVQQLFQLMTREALRGMQGPIDAELSPTEGPCDVRGLRTPWQVPLFRAGTPSSHLFATTKGRTPARATSSCPATEHSNRPTSLAGVA